MFLFGILSSPLPYLLLAVFYFFGFATGMFQREPADSDEILQVQVKNIQETRSLSTKIEKTDKDFHYFHYNFHKKAEDGALSSIQPPPYCQYKKLIYFVNELKIPFTPESDFYFSRPPPNRS